MLTDFVADYKDSGDLKLESVQTGKLYVAIASNKFRRGNPSVYDCDFDGAAWPGLLFLSAVYVL